MIYNLIQDCNEVFPLQLLYNNGDLNGFVWQHIAKLPGDKWEHPDDRAVHAIIDRQPTCVGKLVESPGLSTMHHYFYDSPWFIGCPWSG